MSQSSRSSTRTATDQTRSLLTDYYKISKDRVNTKSISAGNGGKRSISPPSPTSSVRQGTVISDIKDHQSVGSIDSDEQISPEELQKLLLDPKLSRKDKEKITRALIEGDMSFYQEFRNRASSRDGKIRGKRTESSNTLLKELQHDRSELLRMRHRLPKPNFLELSPAAMTIPTKSGREIREEKVALMRRGLTTAGYNPSQSPYSMAAVAQRHKQLQQMQQMNFLNERPPVVHLSQAIGDDSMFHDGNDSNELHTSVLQPMVESITLMQSEQVHHGGQGSNQQMYPISDDVGSTESSVVDMQTGGQALEQDRSINGDFAENSSIELSHREGGDEFSAVNFQNGKSDEFLTSVPNQDKQSRPLSPHQLESTMSMVNNLSNASGSDMMVVDITQILNAANSNQGVVSARNMGQPPVHTPPIPPPARSQIHRGQVSNAYYSPNNVPSLQQQRWFTQQMLAGNIIVKDANPRELYSKLARQDKQKRIAQLKVQLQAGKEHVLQLKAHAQEAIEKKVGLKKQLDGFRAKLKEYLEKHKHPLRGSILRCVDDSMIYHLLQKYDGFALTPEAILMLLGNSLGTSILVDPSSQHERETGIPNNNIISEHPEFAAWKAEEKAAHEHILMERLAPLMEAVTAEGILPVKPLVHDFHSTMNINNYQHYGQRHIYRLPALLHVKKHEDPRDKLDRIALDPNPFRDHDRAVPIIGDSFQQQQRPVSGSMAKPRVTLRPASPPGTLHLRQNQQPVTTTNRPWTTDTHRQPSMYAADGTLQLVQSLAASAPGSPSRELQESPPVSPTVGAGFRMMNATGRLSPLGGNEKHERHGQQAYAQDDMLYLRGAGPSSSLSAQYSLAKIVHDVRHDMLPKEMRPELVQLGGNILELDEEQAAGTDAGVLGASGRAQSAGFRFPTDPEGQQRATEEDDDISSIGDDRSAMPPPSTNANTSRPANSTIKTLGKGGLLAHSTRPASGVGIKTQSAISIMHESLVEEGILYDEPDQVLSADQIEALGKHERTADAVISQVIRMNKFHEQQQMQLVEEAKRVAVEVSVPCVTNNASEEQANDATSETKDHESQPHPSIAPDISGVVDDVSHTVNHSVPSPLPTFDDLNGEDIFGIVPLKDVPSRPSFHIQPSIQLQQFENEESKRPRALHSATSAFLNSPANPYFVRDTDSVGSRSTAEDSELFKPDLTEMQRQSQKRQMIHTPLLSTPDPKEKIDALIVAMSSQNKKLSHNRGTSAGELTKVAPRALKTRELITIYHNRGSHVSRWQQKSPDALGPPPHAQPFAVADNQHDEQEFSSTLDPQLLLLPVSSNESLRHSHNSSFLDPQSLPAISPYRSYNQEVQVISSGIAAGAGLMLWRPRRVINSRDGHAQVARYSSALNPNTGSNKNPQNASAGRSRTPLNGKISKPFVSAS